MERCGKPLCPEAMTGKADDQDPLMQHESPPLSGFNLFYIFICANKWWFSEKFFVSLHL